MSNFPYYEFVHRETMYKVESLFYAIYFMVSFPMFKQGEDTDLTQAHASNTSIVWMRTPT